MSLICRSLQTEVEYREWSSKANTLLQAIDAWAKDVRALTALFVLSIRCPARCAVLDARGAVTVPLKLAADVFVGCE